MEITKQQAAEDSDAFDLWAERNAPFMGDEGDEARLAKICARLAWNAAIAHLRASPAPAAGEMTEDAPRAFFRRASMFGPWIECKANEDGATLFAAAPSAGNALPADKLDWPEFTRDVEIAAQPADSAAAPVAIDQRQAFEHWFSDGGASPKAIERSGENYKLMQAHSAWVAWQAAWSAAQSMPKEYGGTDFGWTLVGIELEEGDKRLATLIVRALGSDHPAVKDLVSLLFRARTKPAHEDKAAAPMPELPEPEATIPNFGPVWQESHLRNHAAACVKAAQADHSAQAQAGEVALPTQEMISAGGQSIKRAVFTPGQTWNECARVVFEDMVAAQKQHVEVPLPEPVAYLGVDTDPDNGFGLHPRLNANRNYNYPVSDLPADGCHDVFTADQLRAYGNARALAAGAGMQGQDAAKLEKAAKDAATSLETISTLSGRESYGNPPIKTYMDTFSDVRSYAAARAKAARNEIAAAIATREAGQ